MISLAELKDFIRERGTVGERQIANHFGVTPPLVAMMCERLAAAGRVRLITAGALTSCGGGDCAECGGSHQQRAWRWVGKD